MHPPAITPPSIEHASTMAKPPYGPGSDPNDYSAADMQLKPIQPGQWIGSAVLRENGDIFVTTDQHFQTHEGVVHAGHLYKPGTPDYDRIVADLGPFKTGEFKPVYAKGMFAP